MKRHQPLHLYFDNTYYFLTARCYKNTKPLIHPERVEQFALFLKETYLQYNYNIIAWVILPNHYHLLFRSKLGNDLKIINQIIHG